MLRNIVSGDFAEASIIQMHLCFKKSNMFFWARRLSYTMKKMRRLPNDIREWFYWKNQLVLLIMKSLFFNEFISFNYVGEIAMEPMFWCVDHFAKILGPIFVSGVVILTSSVVAVVYGIGFPFYWNNHPILLWPLFVLGHWLLINVTFHFYMAATVSPGQPPKGTLITEAVSVCKKCIAPKPPRTHHCSVCNTCILKMDHHCPWLNNCVGHFNHRYFYMYMVFMVAGTVFIMLFGFEIAFKEIWLGGENGIGLSDAVEYAWEIVTNNKEDEELEGHPVRVNNTHMIPVIGNTTGVPMVLEPPPTLDPKTENRNYWYRFFIVYAGILTTGVFFALGGLSVWHGRLITKGESSIEAHINKKEIERLLKINKVYKNPYDFGSTLNWKIFLGLTNGRDWRHVLLPSTHLPDNDGLTWANSIVHAAMHDKAA
ncbi:palmitoyltransferase ZDHHC16 isoform X2 [Oratosquilla oratoria]|uniref:palmitoyltransferase ZDHHC16 isoform X2 n=1 Tax=Oratosquilla oratoria TaxID=337810 RepID=UPI003F76F37E